MEFLLKKRYLECRVLGKHGTGCLVTLAGKLSGKHADPLLEIVTKLLEGKPCETITFDKGKEFARHQEIGNALGTKVYCSHPHSPWERGTNEGKHEWTASAVLPQGEKHDSS